MKSWIVEPCDNPDCDDSEHLFPKPGTQVRVMQEVRAREVGQENIHLIPAGAVGTVGGYVPDWHDVDVVILRTGEADLRVWIDPDNLGTPGAADDTDEADNARSQLLDDLVHEVASQMASNAINAGDQWQFLLSHGWTAEQIREHLDEAMSA
jgi:hypothetical protein